MPASVPRGTHGSIRYGIADDVLIYGIGDILDEVRQNHDINMTQLLERCRAKSIKLNHGGNMGRRP